MCGVLRSACLCVCLFVCLSLHSHIYKITRLNFTKCSVGLYVLPVSVARFASHGSVIRYVLPVLWLTSCFHILEGTGRIKDDARVSSSSPCGGTGGEVYRLWIHLVRQLHLCLCFMRPTKQSHFEFYQGRIHGGTRGRSPFPSLDGVCPKNRDARPIKSMFYQSQNAPKLAFWVQKSKRFPGRGHSPLPQWEEGHPSPHLVGAFGASILAPTALDSTRAFGADRASTSAP